MKNKIAFYPFLFAIFPVIFLYSHNIDEVSFNTIFIPLFFSLSIMLLFWLIFILSIKNKQKAALLTFLLVFAFFSYGHFVNLINNIVFKEIDISAIYLIIFWIILFISISIPVIKMRKNLGNATQILNIFVSALVLFSFSKIAIFHFSTLNYPKSKIEISEDLKLSSEMSLKKEELPDIYYLIFDRYANSKTLKEYYGYDNSDFLNYLKEKGFYIASESKNNYPGSDLSLSSSLNMGYLDYLLEDGPVKKRVIYRLLQDFKVWRLLKSAGYKYFHFGSWWEATRTNKYADYNFKGEGLVKLSQEFLLKFLETTVLIHFSKGKLVSISHRERVLREFDELAKLPEMGAPKFVFSHLAIPHHPFVFGPDGENPRKKGPRKSRNEGYIDQLKFTNKKIKWLISEILETSKNQPIIILQSDEGPGGEEFPVYKLMKLDKDRRTRAKYKIKRRILNAYYLPQINENKLYKTITPVNTFRLIFNLYFGTNYELLEDKTYHAIRGRVLLRKFELVSPNMFVQ